MNRLEKKLIKMDAYDEAIEWASGQTGSFQESWDQCPRGDWMLWLLARSKSNKKKLVLANCQIARTVLQYVPKGEKRPLRAIMAAESWVKGEVDLEEVRKAAFISTSAYASSGAAAYASAAIYAAGGTGAAWAGAAWAGAASSSAAAAGAAWAGAAWAGISDAAGNAAAAAYWAAYWAAAVDAAEDKREASYLNSANIIRKLFPKYPK